MAGTDAIKKMWDRLSPMPGGKRMASFFLGLAVPYTSTIKPLIQELRPGYARVLLRDRRAVRNHLRSVHAVALMNVAELTSMLATLYDLPPTARAIPTGLAIEFHKKARGPITAICETEPASGSEATYEPVVELRDSKGTLVATGHATILVGPIKR